MRNLFLRSGALMGAVFLVCGCTAYQPTKNVWKGTKGLWNTYVSPPASVDYDDKGGLPPEAVSLSSAVMGIDIELGKLERVMQNADKPPTQDWLNSLFSQFPWLNGFAGVKYDGAILGQEPPNSLKELDFIPLLYEDKKQSSRALRADVQPGPLGPEIMLATPLYDGVDFLGIVVAYFDIRSLMRFSGHPENIVALSPGALLWPGKYDFAATPLAGVDWSKVVRESESGACSNSTGSFFYFVRYLGNLPLVFATVAQGNFPEGNGSVDQGAAFFPQERAKLPPPPQPERKSQLAGPMFEAPESEELETPEQPGQEPQQTGGLPQPSERGVIQPGSRESMLLQKGRGSGGRQIQERPLEGEDIEIIRAPERRPEGPSLELLPESESPRLPGGRPSPFGPGNDKREPESPTLPGGRPSPFGPPASARPTPADVQAGAAQDASQTGSTGAEKGAASQPEQGAVQKSGQGTGRVTGLEGVIPLGKPEGGESAPKSPEKPAPVIKEPAREAPAVSEPSVQESAQEKTTAPAAPSTLPGGRPSPFGPRNQ